MVWYVSTNLSQPIDNRGTSSNTFVSLTPGFRTHVGDNWYLLGGVEVPVTSNPAYDYQVLGRNHESILILLVHLDRQLLRLI